MKFINDPSRARNLSGLAFALCALLLLTPAAQMRAQSAAPADEARLLNGLRIVIVNRPGEPKIWMKLRVHSAAAFDLAGREGMTQLLSDALFPDPTTRQYITEELGGQLDVRTTYDSVDVTVSGDSDKFDRLVELLRNAFLQMRLTPDEVKRLKEARLKEARESGSPALAADRAAAARLYGAHPYGRTITGTAESLARIERADLMLARERFHNPNNATLVIVGNVERTRAMRVLRQYLGAWRKGDAIAPSTFRQPDAPDARALIIDAPGAGGAEVRIALRGLARTERDRVAAALLARVARERWQTALSAASAENAASVNAVHDAHALGGVFRLSASVPAASAGAAIESARAVLLALAGSQVSAAELDKAKRDLAAAAATRNRPTPDQTFADHLLDSATFKFDAAQDARALAAAPPTTADLQRVAARLFRDAPQATVIVGPASELRAALASLPGGVEMAGERAASPPAAKPSPTPAGTPPAGAPPASRRP